MVCTSLPRVCAACAAFSTASAQLSQPTWGMPALVATCTAADPTITLEVDAGLNRCSQSATFDTLLGCRRVQGCRLGGCCSSVCRGVPPALLHVCKHVARHVAAVTVPSPCTRQAHASMHGLSRCLSNAWRPSLSSCGAPSAASHGASTLAGSAGLHARQLNASSSVQVGIEAVLQEARQGAAVVHLYRTPAISDSAADSLVAKAHSAGLDSVQSVAAELVRSLIFTHYMALPPPGVPQRREARRRAAVHACCSLQ